MEALEPLAIPEKLERAYWRPESLAKLSDPAELVKYINSTDSLSDSDYETYLHDIGYRLALWHMRAASLRGDIKTVTSCEKYLSRVDLHRQRVADQGNRPAVERQVTTFTMPARPSADGPPAAADPAGAPMADGGHTNNE